MIRRLTLDELIDAAKNLGSAEQMALVAALGEHVVTCHSDAARLSSPGRHVAAETTVLLSHPKVCRAPTVFRRPGPRHPAMRRPRDRAGTGWIDIPPSGDPTKVSLAFQDTDGPRAYLADESGHVIPIATFGDELLCIDGMHAHANDALMWQIDPEKLPPVGAKVTLRLRVRKPDVAPATADPPS